MVLLHIEHAAPNFDAWKAAFDSDPVGRQKSGVRRYRVLRPFDNPNYAIIDLEFDSRDQAEALLGAMQQVWSRVAGTLVHDPGWRISEVVDAQEL
ncbi:MAG: hypothetical protein IT320_05950 [Anaerolineae bacterium]|nr:hypothetical protein [Anaerolineae bacterium]